MTSTRYTHNKFAHTPKEKEYILTHLYVKCLICPLGPVDLLTYNCTICGNIILYIVETSWSWTNLHSVAGYPGQTEEVKCHAVLCLSLLLLSYTSSRSTKTCDDISWQLSFPSSDMFTVSFPLPLGNQRFSSFQSYTLNTGSNTVTVSSSLKNAPVK